MEDATDTTLLARFQAGDDSALDPLFERYEGPIFRFLFGILKDHHEAEDAMQETFVQALRHADGVAPESFRGWLFTVAHQQAVLVKRKEKRWPAQAGDLVLLGLIDRPTADKAAQADEARRIRELMDLLPTAQRTVIAARVFEGKKFREVADALGCPLNT